MVRSLVPIYAKLAIVTEPRELSDLEVSPIDGMPLTIRAAARGLRSGRWTAALLLDMAGQRTARLDPVLEVFAARSHESALAAAMAADADFAAGIDKGPLQGVPLAVKDVIATVDSPTRAQSCVLDPMFFDGHDAPVVARLREHGAVLTGKAVTMEFALGVPDPTSGQRSSRNPFDTSRWTGGSSTGMGAGTQAGLFLGGLGTDTAGSIRIPASFCGVTGLRPTFGTVPTDGVVPLAWSQDTVGPMARSAYDCAVILSAISDHAVAEFGGTRSIAGIRIGVDRRLLAPDTCDPDIAARTNDAMEVLASLGAHVLNVSLPHYTELTTASTLVMCTEGLAYHRENLRLRWTDYGPDTRASLALGAVTTSADYVQAQRVRHAGGQACAELFAEVDVVATPTTLTDAPKLEGLDLNRIVSAITTQYWSALGAPALSIPIGTTSIGLPVGLQLAGPPLADSMLLRLADAFQHVTPHHLMEAPLIAEAMS